MAHMIYHTPYPLRDDQTVASALRPRRMLQAFKNVGYQVIEITGTGRQRRAKIAELEKQLDSGLQVDFCYSEAATVPNSFTERRHFPLRLFVERNFYRMLHRYHIPVGVFYRDIYWVFPTYKQSIPAWAYPVMQALYKWDVHLYNRYVDALFVPSPGYAVQTPGLKVALTPSLPPGTDPRPQSRQVAGDQPRPGARRQLTLFYVGQVGDELYDMSPLRQALRQFPQLHLTLCVPENERWHREAPNWEGLENLTVIHASGDQLPAWYDRADIALLYLRPGEYREFAVPYKFYEYLSYGKPVIASQGTYVAGEVQRMGVGWTAPFGGQDFAALIRDLLDNPDEVAAKTEAARQVARDNTWEARARQVSQILQTSKQERGRRLLIASRIYQPEASAASFRLESVQDAFLRHGWSVDVLTTRYRAACSQRSRKLRVSRWPALRDKSGYLRGYLPYLSFDLPLFWRLLAARRPNLVLVEPPPTTGCVARLAAALRGVPYFWYAPDVWADAVKESASPVVSAAVQAMERFAIRGARGVVTANPAFLDRLRELGATRHLDVAENGVDTRIYTPAGPTLAPEERATFGISKPYFIYAGTASEWQRAELFAEAFAADSELCQKTQLVFVGNGTAWEAIGRIADSLAANSQAGAIVQIDPQPAEAVAKMLRGAIAGLVSLSPDSTYDCAYPTKVFAALGCGTPVIYAGAGPARADIQRENLGWVVNFDRDEVRQAMHEAEAALHGGDAEFAERASQWVRDNHCLEATGERVFDIMAGSLR